jgi:hypothetical protein
MQECYPDAPKDMYAANGRDKKVFIIPSRDLVNCKIRGWTDEKEFDINEVSESEAAHENAQRHRQLSCHG